MPGTGWQDLSGVGLLARSRRGLIAVVTYGGAHVNDDRPDGCATITKRFWGWQPIHLIMAKRESKKHQVIRKLFEGLRAIDSRSEVLSFNTDMVREVCIEVSFKNPFDATKYDTYELLPDCLKEAGYLIVHLGRGDHAFVKGNGYYYLEPITDIKTWPAKKSILDELGVSEASAVSTLFNERVIHDFLFGRREIDLRVHTARRSNVSYKFRVGKNDLFADYLQLEVDGFFERDNLIAAVEVKHGKHTNFEIRQLFTMMKYFEQLQKKGKLPRRYDVRYLYVNRVLGPKVEYFRLYEYHFTDALDFNSIELVRAIQYNLRAASAFPLD